MNYWTQNDIGVLVEHFETKTHEEIGKMLGKSKNSVRNKAHMLGLRKKADEWTDEQIQMLIDAYASAETSDQVKLQELANKIGRLKSNVCRKAKELGLTDIKRKKKSETRKRHPKYESKEERSKAASDRSKKWIHENGHPKGFLGGKHTEEAKAAMSEKLKIFNASLTDDQKTAIKIKAAKTKIEKGTYSMPRKSASWKADWREIGGKRKYFRSRWEANYARYLEFLKSNGEILEWHHEKTTFWFDGVKRGTVSYLPDFDVTEKSGEITHHEVKGWMDDRSATKLKRMAKYHPEKTLVLVQEKQYREIEKKFSFLIPGWEK